MHRTVRAMLAVLASHGLASEEERERREEADRDAQRQTALATADLAIDSLRAGLDPLQELAGIRRRYRRHCSRCADAGGPDRGTLRTPSATRSTGGRVMAAPRPGYVNVTVIAETLFRHALDRLRGGGIPNELNKLGETEGVPATEVIIATESGIWTSPIMVGPVLVHLFGLADRLAMEIGHRQASERLIDNAEEGA